MIKKSKAIEQPDIIVNRPDIEPSNDSSNESTWDTIPQPKDIYIDPIYTPPGEWVHDRWDYSISFYKKQKKKKINNQPQPKPKPKPKPLPFFDPTKGYGGPGSCAWLTTIEFIGLTLLTLAMLPLRMATGISIMLNQNDFLISEKDNKA